MKDLNKIDGLKITNHLTAYNSEWIGFIKGERKTSSFANAAITL